MTQIPFLGYGLGLRSCHYHYILEQKPKIDFFEIISENFIDTKGRPLELLSQIKELYPIVMHGVSLSIGSVQVKNSQYLQNLKKLIDFIEPPFVSDHLCWTGIAHKNTHDLLPLPYTEESLKYIIKQIIMVQDFLERPIALENPSTYLEFGHSTLSESLFIKEMVNNSGCNLLLDVNNLYVNCFNHSLDVAKYLSDIPLDKIIQIHLSGHSNMGTHIIDTHDDFVCQQVWSIYSYVMNNAPHRPNVMVEWDDNIPDFQILQSELDKAKNILVTDLPVIQTNDNKIKTENIPLKQLQDNFQTALLSDDTKLINYNITNTERFEIYQSGYYNRLYEVISEDYPNLKHYLGEQKFDDYIKAYIKNTVSLDYNIANYTKKFPQFIKAKFKDDIAYEISLIETIMVQMVDVGNSPYLTNKDFAGLSAKDLLNVILIPRDGLRLVRTTYNINDYIIDNQRDIIKEAQYLVIYVHDSIVWRLALLRREFYFLKKLFSQKNLANILETTNNITEKNIQDWFANWLGNNLFKEFIL